MTRANSTVQGDAPARMMARRPPVAAAPTTTRTLSTARAVDALVALMALAYAAFFIYLAWLRYHTYLMHALDMGNMAQAVWNTAHGHPFHFNNLRLPWQIEASGTTTRLSFHVEPILLLIAIPYLVFSSPVTLIVIQAVVVATGVFPAAWLARRYLQLPLAELVFPLAYLLAPALQAATLYEFHAVTLSAALLLWAFYFADGRRYGLFALFGLLALATKEEIGLVVAMMGLWIWWRHRDRTVGLVTAVLAAGWSFFAVFVVMHHFHTATASPYCARFDPTIANGYTAASKVVTCTHIVKLWLGHPDLLLNLLLTTPKLGFLHRILIDGGYLSLLSPLTLAISLPSYALILLSNDVHMYSGVGHYSAELVPIIIASAIVGTAWLAKRLGPRLRLSPTAITTVACLWLLVASLANQRVNGFTPLYEGFSFPAETAHDQIGQRILALIPPNASVAASDFLNPHLSDRQNIYLFPDIDLAQYAVVDVSRDRFPLAPLQEMLFIRDKMLKSGDWGIVAAQDGYILMERKSAAPRLPSTLPPAFYSFVTPTTPPAIAHPLDVWFGPALQLVGYKVERREQINVRQADVVLTTYWRLTQQLTAPITPVVYLTNGTGALDTAVDDHPATDWLPTTQWPLNRIVSVTTTSLPIYAAINGHADVDLAVYRPGAYDLLADSVDRYLPAIRAQQPGALVQAVGNNTILKLTSLPINW